MSAGEWPGSITDEDAHSWEERPRGVGAGARLHGNELVLQPDSGPEGDDPSAPRGRGSRRYVLRYGRGLRPVSQRRAGRRSACSVSWKGRDRDEVRMGASSRRRGEVESPQQPTSAHQESRRRFAQAPEGRCDRPPVPASCGPRRPDRRGGRSGQGTHPRGQGQALRPLRGRCEDHSSRARGPGRHRRPERVFALVPRAREGSAADARGAWNRLRSIQPSRKGLSHGKIDETTTLDGADFRSSIPRFSAENRRANQVLVDLLRRIAQRKGATPGQIALAWLLAQTPAIVPIPGTTKQLRLEENVGAVDVELAPDDLREIESAASKITIQGARYPEHIERMSNR